MPTDLLTMRGIRKCFFGTPVNNDVSELMQLLEEVSMLREAYSRYILDSGSWLLTA